MPIAKLSIARPRDLAGTVPAESAVCAFRELENVDEARLTSGSANKNGIPVWRSWSTPGTPGTQQIPRLVIGPNYDIRAKPAEIRCQSMEQTCCPRHSVCRKAWMTILAGGRK